MGRVFTITEGLENMGALKTGGQGSVYKARRIGEIITAVKLLPTPIHSESSDDKNFISFRNEVEKLKKVNEQPNPNVVKILSSGITETGNLPFIEMEFIEGPDLEELLKPPHEPIFTVKEVIKVADQLAHALAHCHSLDVRHGDIKSNNVKFNIHTGNYVLLDFGLAVMSDEQRRTSLRQAGAIEFMAPEQSEGRMLFQTDIYSFGIILFELLAGTVPFPLKDNGEMARNRVMLAHMETPPPDIISLRKQALPETWSEEKKDQQMNVPDWLLNTIYKCLQKKPDDRFANGIELYDYIMLNSTLAAKKNAFSSDQLGQLQQQKEKLITEKEQLQKLLSQYQDASGNKEQELVALRVSVAQKDREIRTLKERAIPPASPQKVVVKRGVPKISFYALFLLTIGLGVLAAYAFLSRGSKANQETSQVKSAKPSNPQPVQRKVISQYKVVAPKAYFHNEPDESTRRNAFVVPSGNVINGLDEQNGFVYTEFTNGRGQTSKGWLKKDDLISLEDWTKQQMDSASSPHLTKIEINAALQRANALLENDHIKEALPIYKTLADQDVPEAMYQYGNLALKNKNKAIDCNTAIELLKKASNEDYTPAKRILGFLYLFAKNKEVLKLRNYDRCPLEKNVLEGSKLLMEAVLSGDSTSNKILENFKSGSNEMDSTNNQ